MVEYCHKTIADTSIERGSNHLWDDIIPHHTEENNHQQNTVSQNILQAYNNISPSLTTIYCWIKTGGFKYEQEKKYVYFNGHEKPEQKLYRYEFIKLYFRLEL